MIKDTMVATRFATGLVTSSASLVVEGGAPITVVGFIIGKDDNAAGANIISMKSGDGTITYGAMLQAQQRLVKVNIAFTADKGLSFTGSSTTAKRITVFYISPGR